MDAADVISKFGKSIAGIRRIKAKVINGRAQLSLMAPFTLVAVVYPASGRDLLRLPEGRRSVETRALLTSTQLFVGAAGSPNESDLLTLGSQQWEVQHCELWDGTPDDAGPFYQAIVQVAG